MLSQEEKVILRQCWSPEKLPTLSYWVQSAEAGERHFTSQHEKRSYFPRAWGKGREQKYFINGRLTPVWVPLSAPYPTQAIFWAGYGVINYILTASLCSFDFTVIKSAIEVSGLRKCGSQVREGGGARAIPDPWRCGKNKGDDLCGGLFIHFTPRDLGLAPGIDLCRIKVPHHWKMPILSLISYSFWLTSVIVLCPYCFIKL